MSHMAPLYLLLICVTYIVVSIADDIYWVSVQDYRDHPLDILDNLSPINESDLESAFQNPIVEGLWPIEYFENIYGDREFFEDLKRNWHGDPVDDNQDWWSCVTVAEGGLSNQCWKILNLDKWLQYWFEANKDSDSKVFAESFMVRHRFPENCTAIIDNNCGLPASIHLRRQ